jgi:hypothetical protein
MSAVFASCVVVFVFSYACGECDTPARKFVNELDFSAVA